MYFHKWLFLDEKEWFVNINFEQLPLEVKNLVCRIYLGDDDSYKEHGRECFKKPVLESPVISFGMYITDFVDQYNSIQRNDMFSIDIFVCA